MNKGFTLMEVLAVVMVLALVGAMAVPSFRASNAEQRFRRAKISLMKLGQAIRTMENDGNCVNTDPSDEKNYSFVGTESDDFLPTNANLTYDDCGTTGVPRRSIPSATGACNALTIKWIFFCGDFRAKDFIGLPYKFTYVREGSDLTTGQVFMEGVGGAGKYIGKKCRVDINDLSKIKQPESNDECDGTQPD